MLDETQIDSDAANPKEPLASTVAAYNFDGGEIPYENSTDAELPATATVEYRAVATRPEFSEEDPADEEGDYSLYFDGNDRVTFVDEMDIMQFVDESFSFEAWVKFNAEDQVSDRPVLFAYGIGGANGYSFSFRVGNPAKVVEESPSGAAGDYAVDVNGGMEVDDSEDPILNIIEGPITMEAWINVESLNTYNGIAAYGSSYKIGINNEELVWTFYGVEDVFSGVPFEADSTWHHVAMAWEPGIGANFYVDGEFANFVETENFPRELENNILNVGSETGGNVPMNGMIDRVRVHNALLDETQIDSDAANPKAPLDNTVVAYDFDGGSLPAANKADAERPAESISKGSTITVTTYGIVDAHSEDAIIPDDGQWHHIAAVHEIWTEFRYYVDGELLETRDYDGGVRFAEVFDFLIGSEANGGHPYVGYLDRIKISRAALTADELGYFEPVSIENWSLY